MSLTLCNIRSILSSALQKDQMNVLLGTQAFLVQTVSNVFVSNVKLIMQVLWDVVHKCCAQRFDKILVCDHWLLV